MIKKPKQPEMDALFPLIPGDRWNSFLNNSSTDATHFTALYSLTLQTGLKTGSRYSLDLFC